MTKFLVLLLPLFSFHFAQGENLRCQGSGVSLVASPTVPATTPATLQAKVKTKHSRKTKTYTLKIAPRKDTLNYADYWTSKGLWLSLGKFQGQGSYSGAKLTLSDINDSGRNFTLDCKVSGQINFKNYCEKTSSNDPQQNLFYAAENKMADLLTATLACDVDVNAENKNGCSPLLVLIDRNCGTGKFDPFSVGNIENLVVNLLDSGANISAIDPATQESALAKATRVQDSGTAKRLLELEADIDAQDSDGFTPLMRAVETRVFNMVALLAESGANLDLQNSEGLTALQIAQQSNYSELYLPLSGMHTITVQGSKSGLCSTMEISLIKDKPNRIVLKTENSMLMLDSSELGISLMASSGNDDSTIVTPTNSGQFKMTCGPKMGPGNPEGRIVVN